MKTGSLTYALLIAFQFKNILTYGICSFFIVFFNSYNIYCEMIFKKSGKSEREKGGKSKRATERESEIKKERERERERER